MCPGTGRRSSGRSPGVPGCPRTGAAREGSSREGRAEGAAGTSLHQTGRHPRTGTWGAQTLYLAPLLKNWAVGCVM